jgi:hypothetical protein
LKSIKRNALLCLLFTPLALGVAQAAEPAATRESIEQVIVKGKRADLVKLAKEVLIAEERFYQRYNDINTKRQYMVRCYNEAPTGTRFKQKYCKPVFENEADATEARDFMMAIGRGASAGSTSGGAVASGGVMAAGGSPGTSGSTGYGTGASMTSTAGNSAISGGGTVASFIEIETGRPDFQKNVVEVANKSPELQKLLREHAEAVKRYEALYNQVNGDAPATAEKSEGAPPPSE